MERSRFLIFMNRIILIYWTRFVRLCFACVLFAFEMAFKTYSAQQTISDVVTESTFDFSGLSEKRGYGSLGKTPAGKAVVDQVVKHMIEDRVGVWESFVINGPLPAPLEKAQTLYVELMTNAAARLCIRERGGAAVKEIPFIRGFFTDRSIYVGSDDDGILFIYTLVGDRMYTLFNPNGCQKRIYFRKSSAVLPNAAYKDRKPVLPFKGGDDSRDGYNRQDGWYVCTRFPSMGYGGRQFEKLFLIINSHSSENGAGHHRAFPVFYKDGTFYMDAERWRYPDYMDGREGPFGFYSFSGSEIAFDMAPPDKGELAMIRLRSAYALHADTNRTLFLAMEVINQDNRFISLFTRWMADGSDGRKLLFRKTETQSMSPDNIRFISLRSDEVSTNKDLAETYLEMINRRSY